MNGGAESGGLAASDSLRSGDAGPIFLAVDPDVNQGTVRISESTPGQRKLSVPSGENIARLLSGLPTGLQSARAMLRLMTNPDPSMSQVAIFSPRMGNDENRVAGGPATSVITKVKPKARKPNLYRVLILNDDYTPMEFVVHVLEKFFQKDVEAATKIMLHVHHHGIGECGIFTYEIAETKVTQVMDFARKHQHPLQCVMEKK